MKILVAPDSFKGTLSALEAAHAIAAGLQDVLPTTQIQTLPLADGGEGTMDALLHGRTGNRETVMVTDANGARTPAIFGLFEDGHGGMAVLEAAQVVGLPQARIAVMQRTTRGLGELMRHALYQGSRRFLIGLGGSSTNDGGAGLLVALGVQLQDAAGREITPNPEGLAELARVDFSQVDARLRDCDITVLTDVDNPLCGPMGATATFGPQKGVMPDQIAMLDARLAHFARLCDTARSSNVSQQAGAGAAGGLGYALMLLGAKRRRGGEVVCEQVQLNAALHDADWVITGEGKSDAQTLQGKLPMIVAQHARRAGVKVVLLSGAIETDSLNALNSLFDHCIAVVNAETPLAVAMQSPGPSLRQRARSLAQWIQAQS